MCGYVETFQRMLAVFNHLGLSNHIIYNTNGQCRKGLHFI